MGLSREFPMVGICQQTFRYSARADSHTYVYKADLDFLMPQSRLDRSRDASSFFLEEVAAVVCGGSVNP